MTTSDGTLNVLRWKIALDPPDDLARLMYADRCEELATDGHPDASALILHAELIRRQIEAYNAPPCPKCGDTGRYASGDGHCPCPVGQAHPAALDMMTKRVTYQTERAYTSGTFGSYLRRFIDVPDDKRSSLLRLFPFADVRRGFPYRVYVRYPDIYNPGNEKGIAHVVHHCPIVSVVPMDRRPYDVTRINVRTEPDGIVTTRIEVQSGRINAGLDRFDMHGYPTGWGYNADPIRDVEMDYDERWRQLQNDEPEFSLFADTGRRIYEIRDKTQAENIQDSYIWIDWALTWRVRQVSMIMSRDMAEDVKRMNSRSHYENPPYLYGQTHEEQRRLQRITTIGSE